MENHSANSIYIRLEVYTLVFRYINVFIHPVSVQVLLHKINVHFTWSDSDIAP